VGALRGVCRNARLDRRHRSRWCAAVDDVSVLAISDAAGDTTAALAEWRVRLLLARWDTLGCLVPGRALSMSVAAHVTALSEDQVLHYAWEAASDPDTDRLQLLRQLSVVVIQRPATWDVEAIRRVNPWVIPLDVADRCFNCRTGDRRLYWHRIISVSHGGSNQPANFVAVCYRCRRVLRPSLPERSDASEIYRITRGQDLDVESDS
jgi:hypothetical protein